MVHSLPTTLTTGEYKQQQQPPQKLRGFHAFLLLLAHLSLSLQVLDYVQAAHVWLQRRWTGPSGDQQRYKRFPRGIRQDYLLRLSPPGADVFPVGPQTPRRQGARIC